MAEDGVEHGRLAVQLSELTRPGTPVVRAVLRPRPLADVRGRRVAFFGTAPAAQHERIAAHLRAVYGADVCSVSGSLSDRAALRRELAGLDADVVVVEIKAAAIDVVAEEAERRGIEVVLAGNDVVPLAGEADLDAELERLAAEAIASAMVGV
jgi:cyclic 2,3-diphosphoglycerate synthetase